MNKLTITVEGRHNSGKTVVSKIIREALMREGITATINDQDGMNALNGSDTRRGARALKERSTSVTINQRSTPRDLL